MKYIVQAGSCVMTPVQIFMKIGTAVGFKNFRCCIVGITDARDL
jgi:hypothetical protein